MQRGFQRIAVYFQAGFGGVLVVVAAAAQGQRFALFGQGQLGGCVGGNRGVHRDFATLAPPCNCNFAVDALIL